MAAKFKIGIFGSASGDYKKVVPLAEKLGRVLGEHADSVIVVTGACTGLPYVAAAAAAHAGCEVWGYSSSFDRAGLRVEYPDDDLNIYSKLIYMPEDFPFASNLRICRKYRNVISTANCDAGIFISGLWGTLNEFTNTTDFQKPAGILTGTGGVADELVSLTKKISKEGQGPVVFSDDPQALIAKILATL
jgi:predicted Rossmann-fold nucleotide-binding protein